MKNTRNRVVAAGRFFVSLVVMMVMVFGGVVPLPAPLSDILGLHLAEAAQVTVDASTAAAGTDHNNGRPSLVFVSDTSGYQFYRDSGNTCVYSKTTDGGLSWNTAVTVDSQADCIGIAVWYDQWTPQATGTKIHIATIDTGNDDIFYNVLETSNDSLGLSTATTTDRLAGQVATLATGGNSVSIVVNASGTIFASVADTSDSFVMSCSTNCTNNLNWAEAGTSPLDLANDYSILVPLKNNNVMIVNRDISANDIRSKIWSATNTAWTTTWVPVDANAIENVTYDVAMSAQVSSTTGRVHLAYVTDHGTLGTDDDIRTATFENNAWTLRTDVLTNDAKGITDVSLGLDQNDDTVFVAYAAATTPTQPSTQNVFYKMSSSTMQGWSVEFGGLVSSTSDMYGISLSGTSPQRMYATWFDNISDDIYGDTLFDTAPGLRLGTTTSQTAQVRATTSNFFIGGAFSLYENNRTRDITSVTLTEEGSIDAATGLKNIKLFYESDTTYPYNCTSESYSGSETQFGSTDVDGFSDINGTSTFSDTVSVGTSSALCVYPVMDVVNAAQDLSTIDISIADPVNDVIFTQGDFILPTTTVAITGSTTVFDDDLSLVHYHWRNDDGSESGATSATGGTEDTAYTTYPFNTAKRLRVEVSNEGSTTTLPTQFRLEYAPKTFVCSQETNWINVDAAGGDWDMQNSANLTDGSNTTNVAAGANGAVTDENTTFLVANAGQKDTSSQTSVLTLSTTTFAELEYSIIASTTATAGSSYCFRLTDASTTIDLYDVYPEATISSDIFVSGTSTPVNRLFIPTTDAYVGGAFVVQAQTAGTRTLSAITITASGSVDYANDLDNIELRYDLDTSSPYNCASESYVGGETQYGSTDTDGFTAGTGTSTFSGSVQITPTQALCLYTIFDVGTNASNGELLDIQITDPETDIVRDSGTIGPGATVRILENTELVVGIPTQVHFHFRNDDGSEVAATSKTAGTEDTALTNISNGTTTRLRIEVSNEGGTSTAAMQYRLEYAQKVTSCSAASGWTDVGDSGGDWDMQNSTNLTDGSNTTNIAVATGGVTDENATFLASNAGQKDTSSQTSGITLASTTFTEIEYSIVSSSTVAAENATYCFRVTDAGTALLSYNVYPEIGLKNARDFKVQRGVSAMGVAIGTVTITAGVDYVAPAASTSAFIRITNTQHTGGGATTSVATQNADDSTVYITNPSNIGTSVTFQRQTTAPANSTRFAWEIVEYIGPAGGDNEMIVRQQETMTFGTASTTASSTASALSVVTDADVAVFITGVWNPDTIATNYNSMLTTASWAASTDRAVFTRGTTGSDAVRVSFAVIEFTGANWNVQRVSHTYTATGTAETENITAVNSTSRAFLHVQKTAGTGLTTHANYGHEVWLSSVGAVSFQIEAQATSPALHTSVAWVIENTQTKDDVMLVTRSSGTQSGGAQPLASSTNIGATLEDITAASIFANSRSTGITSTFPEPMMMVELISTSTTQYRIWVSNTTDSRTYRTEVVEWPTARRELAQNYYRIYVNNDVLDPTDPWPVGATDLGENTAMSGLDLPMAPGDDARIRMSLNVSGQSSMPPGVDAFKLQYGKRLTSCSAISSWQDLGDSSSTTAAWRANDTAVADETLLSVNPPSAGDLNLSVSDRAGTYEENNNTALTTYIARSGEDMEFDWSVENNIADTKSSYCFRMVETDDSLFNAYNFYPTLRTIGYGAESQNWRWYDDAETETPTTPLDGAAENTTPINVTFDNTIALRFTLKESNGAQGNDVKFKLQFSESPTFDTTTDVSGSSTCAQLSYWCYDDGGGADNAVILTKLLSDSETCSGGVGRGCGTHNASGTSPTTYDQPATSSAEFSFIIRHAGARVNRTYYFRAYDTTNNEAIVTAVGESYPSLTTEGAELTFVLSGVATSTTVEGVTTDVGTTPTAIPFGSLPEDTPVNAAYELDVSTDATEGYQVYVLTRQGLLSSSGDEIAPVAASNTAPTAWGTACVGSADGCFGYHAGDDTLAGGSARFSPDDTYAALETAPQEVAFSSIPVVNEQTTVIYRALARALQPAGQYETEVVFISVPVF